MLSRVQRQTCWRFGVGPVLPKRGTTIGIAPSRGRDLLPLNAIRHPPGGRSNGWFVWRGGRVPLEDNDFLQPSHVEDLW